MRCALPIGINPAFRIRDHHTGKFQQFILQGGLPLTHRGLQLAAAHLLHRDKGIILHPGSIQLFGNTAGCGSQKRCHGFQLLLGLDRHFARNKPYIGNRPLACQKLTVSVIYLSPLCVYADNTHLVRCLQIGEYHGITPLNVPFSALLLKKSVIVEGDFPCHGIHGDFIGYGLAFLLLLGNVQTDILCLYALIYFLVPDDKVLCIHGISAGLVKQCVHFVISSLLDITHVLLQHILTLLLKLYLVQNQARRTHGDGRRDAYHCRCFLSLHKITSFM